jgi:hypothetical protein
MILLNLDNFDTKNVYFGNLMKNNIINDGSFRHINYSTQYFSLNTIYIRLPLKMNFIFDNKLKIFFKKKDNEETINKIRLMEEEILKSIDKTNQLKITKYLENEMIVIHSPPPQDFFIILKISGLWETETQCGLTFKFIIHPLKSSTILSNSML